MRKKILLFGITLAAMLSSCYGPNDSVYTEDLDVVYTQKRDGYDFTPKNNCYVSDTIVYMQNDDDKIIKLPNEKGEYEKLSREIVDKLVYNLKFNLEQLGWTIINAEDLANDDSTGLLPYPDSINFKNSAIMNAVIIKTTNTGVTGGYYPYYPYFPGWDWWYPGYAPWYPIYYSYTTGSVMVNMLDINEKSDKNDGEIKIWEIFLSGYARNGINVTHVNNGITQGFRQSEKYLAK